ncbi:MAG: hypothetical protein WBV82_20510 [Myxococcaceae bacterium]
MPRYSIRSSTNGGSFGAVGPIRYAFRHEANAGLDHAVDALATGAERHRGQADVTATY